MVIYRIDCGDFFLSPIGRDQRSSQQTLSSDGYGDFAGLRAALQAVDRRGNSVVTKQKFPPKHIYGSLQEEVVANRRETLQRWLTVAMEQYRRAVPLISFLEDDGSDNSTPFTRLERYGRWWLSQLLRVLLCCHCED